MKTGFIFILLSAVIIIVTGLFVWSSGIQLNKVSSIDTSLEVMPYTYETLSADVGSPLWVISNLFVYGGIGLALLSFGLTVRQRRQERAEASEF